MAAIEAMSVPLFDPPLEIVPVAGVVPIAKRAGARVVILNAEPTEMDELADAVLRGSISSLLPRLVESA